MNMGEHNGNLRLSKVNKTLGRFPSAGKPAFLKENKACSCFVQKEPFRGGTVQSLNRSFIF